MTSKYLLLRTIVASIILHEANVLALNKPLANVLGARHCRFQDKARMPPNVASEWCMAFKICLNNSKCCLSMAQDSQEWFEYTHIQALQLARCDENMKERDSQHGVRVTKILVLSDVFDCFF